MVLVLVVLVLMVPFHSCPFDGDRRKTPPFMNARKGQKCALKNQVQSHARERTFIAAPIVLFVTTNNEPKKHRSNYEQVINEQVIDTQPSAAHY